MVNKFDHGPFFGRNYHGGILLSLMDKVTFACASKHADNYCVTVSVEIVEFLEPVEVGEMVTMFASVNYFGKSPMIIGMKEFAKTLKLSQLNIPKRLILPWWRKTIPVNHAIL